VLSRFVQHQAAEKSGSARQSAARPQLDRRKV